jgi:hypothetical protein
MHSSTVVLTIILQKNPIILLGLSLVSNEPFFIVFWLAGILMFVWRVNLHACLLVQRSLLLLACVRACVRACVLAAAATCLLAAAAATTTCLLLLPPPLCAAATADATTTAAAAAAAVRRRRNHGRC